jgi:hypothetical protein
VRVSKFENRAVSNTDIILELQDGEQRETSSGLMRVDREYFGPAINQLVHNIGDVIDERIHASWGMVHKPGSAHIFSHHHNTWNTAIYYPLDHPSALLLDGAAVLPRAGTLVILERGEMHGVASNETAEERYSVVMTFHHDYAT